MGSVRSLSATKTLFLDFGFRAQRCREYTSLEDTPANRKRLRNFLERIEAEIAVGTFDYARHFPNSKLAVRFGAGQEAAHIPTPHFAGHRATAAVQTQTFRDFAKEWYIQHEIEWKRSYRRTAREALDQHLVPRFGEMDVRET
jgi:integrase